MKRFLMATVFAFGINTAAIAQGIPTYDVTAVSKMLEQIKQGKQQLDSMQDQLLQMKELYGSLNGLTDTSKIQDILQMPDVRNALPANFGDYEALLKGSASGAIGDTANRFHNEQGYKPSGGSAQERTHNFYQDELQKAQKHNAGQAATGEAIYKAAEEKAKAIDEIAQRLKKAETPKEVQDLTAQLDAVQATLQTDVLKMQAVSMVQQAQLQAAQVREQEMFRARLKAVADTYE